jgi:hypothetical protein
MISIYFFTIRALGYGLGFGALKKMEIKKQWKMEIFEKKKC